MSNVSTEYIGEILKAGQKGDYETFHAYKTKLLQAIMIIDELSDEIDGIEFYKCNVDENQELAMRFGIMSIPTIMVFKAGEPIFNSVGAAPKGKLKAELEKLTA
jgi:thioredoxin-like negative regulator of GroEL